MRKKPNKGIRGVDSVPATCKSWAAT